MAKEYDIKQNTLRTLSNHTSFGACRTSKMEDAGAYSQKSREFPAHIGLSFAIKCSEELVGRVGRHRINLLYVYRRDLRKRNIFLESYENFVHIRELAQDRTMWKNLYKL